MKTHHFTSEGIY